MEVFFIKVFRPFNDRMEVVMKLSDNERLAVFTGISSSLSTLTYTYG